jgi:DnaJ domain
VIPIVAGMAVDDPSTVDAHLRFPWREQRREHARRCCAWPDCADEGLYRAPRSRNQLREFVWFCLDHVREYNRQWDFFAGMTPDQIDAQRKADVTWHRPTWRFAGSWEQAKYRFADPFGFFADEDVPPPRPRPSGRAADMMTVLELDEGFTLDDLRRRYKAMVKRFHPDLHGGDKASEAKLREVIEAYRYLRDNKLYA